MFKKYSSIENNYSLKTIAQFQKYINDTQWAITEKVHGSNFSINYDSNGNKSFARKSAILQDTEKFMDYQNIIKDYIAKYDLAYQEVKKLYPNSEHIHFFGELYGNQKDINYNGNGFYGFDIYVDNRCMDYSDICKIYNKFDILHASPIQIGTFNEVLQYNVEDKFSTLSQSTKWEGVVLRPLKTMHTPNGKRLILKIKTKQYSDIKNIPPTNQSISQWDNILLFNTDTRIHSMVGKIGHSNNIINLIIDDIIIDYEKQFSKLSNNKIKKYSNKLKNIIQQSITRLY